MTNANLVFGKNKVFIVDDFSDLEPFGEEQNLYVVRFKDDGTEETKAYEWRNNAYHPFTFGSGSNDNPTNDNVSVVIVDTRYDLPIPADAKFSTLYVVLKDITAEHKTTMYIRVEDAYLLLAAFSAGGAVQEYTQVTKLGVEATLAAPKIYAIDIPRTTNFLRAPIEVLRFTRGNTGVVHSVITFDNGDATDFLPNEHVVFDGKMQLKTEYPLEMQKDESWMDDGSLHSIPINRSEWLRIDKLNVLHIAIFDKDISNLKLNKTLIFSNDNYKKYDTTLGWQTVSATTPTTEGFLEHGIDDISTLSRKVQNLPPQPLIDKTSILLGSESEGKVFGKTLELNKYMDIRKIEVK